MARSSRTGEDYLAAGVKPLRERGAFSVRKCTRAKTKWEARLSRPEGGR